MPATIIELERRLTRKYNDDHSYLDKWEDSGLKIRKLQAKVYSAWEWALKNGDDPDRLDPSDAGGSIFHFIVMPPTKVPARTRKSATSDDQLDKFQYDLRQMVYDNFTHSGCSCEYDCCGCSFSRLRSLKRVGRREWRVEITHGRNY